jgi:hypothetical protein
MYLSATKALSKKQQQYFYLSMLQMNHLIKPGEKLILASLNNKEGFGFQVRFVQSANRFGVRFIVPKARSEEGYISEWEASAHISFDEVNVEHLLGLEDFDEAKLSSGGSYASTFSTLPSNSLVNKIGSNDESYYLKARDYIYIEGIKLIHSFLQKVKTNAQSQLNQTLTSRAFQDFDETLLEELYSLYHDEDFFKAKANSMFHSFIKSFGDKLIGLNAYRQWLIEAINGNKLIIDEHFIDQPSFIQYHSISKVFSDLKKVFHNQFGILQIIESNQHLKNGTYAFQITDDFGHLELYPFNLVTYIHSDGTPYLLLDARYYNEAPSTIKLDFNDVDKHEFNLSKDYQDQNIDKFENAVEFWQSNVNHPGLVTTVIAEEIIIKQFSHEQYLYQLPKIFDSLLDSEDEEYPSLRRLCPNIEFTLSFGNGSKFRLRGFGYIHLLMEYYSLQE